MLIDTLRAARRGKGWTRDDLAREIKTDVATIKRLENGVGTIATLIDAMRATELHLSGFARGGTIVDQMHNARERMGMTREALANRAGISRTTLMGLEHGEGTIRPLLKVIGVLAPCAYRATPARAHWAPDRADERDIRFTPQWYLDAIEAAFGKISLDPCAHPLSPVVAERRIILPEDGLPSSWAGSRLAYVNPPFSGLLKWINRAADAFEAGECETIVMLCPVRTDSATWRDRVAGRTRVGLLEGRMLFGAPPGTRAHVTPFSLMTVIWGGEADRVAQFATKVPAHWI